MSAVARWKYRMKSVFMSQNQADLDLADAAIAELEAEIADAENRNLVLDEAVRLHVERLANARADARRWRTLHGKAVALLEKAEAEVAALTAECSAPWHVGAFIDVDGFQVGPHMVREYRAELAALKARRCEGCKFLLPGIMDPDSCPVIEGFPPTGIGFSCSEWTAREDGES